MYLIRLSELPENPIIVFKRCLKALAKKKHYIDVIIVSIGFISYEEIYLLKTMVSCCYYS